MKSVIISSFVIFLIIVISVSCNKNKDDSPTILPAKTVSLSKVSADLITINHKFNAGQKKRTFQYYSRIFAADCGGAWVGSRLGLMFSGGNPWGALAGAAVVGFAGSYGASIGVYHSPDGDNIYAKVALYNSSYTLSNPNGNPYDESVGKRHNYLLKDGTVNNPMGGPINDQYLFSNMSLTSDESNFLTDKREVVISIYNDMRNSESTNSIKSIITSNIDDSLLTTTMNSYLDGLSTLTNPNDAIALAKDYEVYIGDSNLFTLNQKDCLLQGLAVAKYSCYFWTCAMD